MSQLTFIIFIVIIVVILIISLFSEKQRANLFGIAAIAPRIYAYAPIAKFVYEK